MNGKEIRAIQQIYSKILNTKIDLPKIVVVGPQSSGKSSVLEQILQLDFLPRGVNMVTRCPIVINLRKSKEEFVAFQDEKEKYTATRDVQKRIEEKMNEICGPEGVSRVPLVLYAYLKEALETTLIDLPGLTKIPVGRQPKDIEKQIEEIVVEYSSGDSTIILAVINANVDIGNSEALKIAKSIDPRLERTLGVVTKIDLMDEGTNCVRLLKNEHSPLGLGYIGVLNRSFQDVQNNTPFEEVKKKEEEFFRNKPYDQFKGRIGSSFLLEKLHFLFCEKVRGIIPALRKEINNLLEEKQEEARENYFTSVSMGNILINYFYCLKEVVGDPQDRAPLFVYGEENILYAFKTAFDRFHCVFRFEDLEKEIRCSDSLIFHERVIKDLVRKNSTVILNQLTKRIEESVGTLYGAISKIRSPRLPRIASILNSISLSKAEGQYELLMSDLKKYIQIQGLYINSKYPGFDVPSLLTDSCEEVPCPVLNDIEFYSKISFSLKNKVEVEKEAIRKIASKYLEILKTNAVDYALKAIYFHFLHYFKNESLCDFISIKVEEAFGSEFKELEEELKELEKVKEGLDREIKDLKESKRILDKYVGRDKYDIVIDRR